MLGKHDFDLCRKSRLRHSEAVENGAPARPERAGRDHVTGKHIERERHGQSLSVTRWDPDSLEMGGPS